MKYIIHPIATIIMFLGILFAMIGNGLLIIVEKMVNFTKKFETK
jgi:hypothetical protein